ncbi:MAG TPA: hypothetical protein PKL77_09545 [Candidatus Omnitrophota bacterium]|nr:hypothetical protein [Candidatus Omnitrophota bacterium]
MGTYNATPTHIFNTYYGNSGYTDSLMKQGMVYTSETKTVSPYNAWRSLVWFDGAAIESALTGQRVTAVGLNAKSTNDQLETPADTSIRLYRTNLTYNADNAGKNSANTVQFTAGMTYDSPYNDYFLEYGETTQLARGGTMTNGVFLTGQSAVDFVSALVSGYAMGNFVIKSGASYTGRALARYLSDVSLTIEYTLDNTDVTAPLHASVDTSVVSAGTDGKIGFSGAVAASETNPITGYNVRHAESNDNGATWGEWSSPVYTEMQTTSGAICVTAGAVGTYRKYQIATVGQLNTSDYVNVTGTIRAVALPSAPTVVASVDACLVTLSVTVEASNTGIAQFVSVGVDTQTPRIMNMTKASGGTTVVQIITQPGEHAVHTAIMDARGNSGAETLTNVSTQELSAGNNWMEFCGVSSRCVGALVTKYAQPNTAARRTEDVQAVGVPGSFTITQGENVYDAFSLTVEMLVENKNVLAYARRWLAGSGDIRFGSDPDYYMRARIDQPLSFERVSTASDMYYMTVQADVQPFRMLEAEKGENISVYDTKKIYNAGDVKCYPVIIVYGSGDTTVTVGTNSITLTGITEYYKIDCYYMTVEDENGNAISTYSGEFPLLEIGESAVSWTGLVTDVTIDRRQSYR